MINGMFFVNRLGHAKPTPLLGPSQNGRDWSQMFFENNYNLLQESLSLGHVTPAANLALDANGEDGRLTNFFEYVIRPAGVELGLPENATTAAIMKHVQRKVNGNRSIRNHLPQFLEGRKNLRGIVQAGCQAWIQFSEREEFVLQQRKFNVGPAGIIMPQF